MTEPSANPFVQAMRVLLDETFDEVKGIFLDSNTSFFETLSDITAEEASIPVGGKCATLAAQVKHTAFYLDVVVNSARDPDYPRADWGHIWRTVGEVSPDEWQAINRELRESYQRILQLLEETPAWDDPYVIGGAIGVVAHTAYHLGEVRQALCTLRS